MESTYLIQNDYGKLMPLSLILILTVGLAALFKKRAKKIVKPILQEEIDACLQKYQPETLIHNEEIYKEPRALAFHQPDIENPFTSIQNLCISDYYCLRNSNDLKSIATNCIKFNGVGSCGPRGFYGTIDVHLSLEDQISEFMKLEQTILYSYCLSTMSSAILAYCKKGDLLFCDEKVLVTSIDAMNAAKATIIYHKHNDMVDLELKLQEHENKKNRKFMLVEGIYSRTGKICNLPKLMELRKRYKLRMFLDEMISFGSLGKHGRGVTEYYNVDRTDIDLIAGSLEHSVPSIGGFCVGSSFVIDHQCLSGLGYCFSASLPPLHSYIAKHTISMFESNPEMIQQLNEVAISVHNKFDEFKDGRVISDKLSPIKVIEFKNTKDVNAMKNKAQSIGLLFGSETGSNTIYFNVNVLMDSKYIETLYNTFNWLCNSH